MVLGKGIDEGIVRVVALIILVWFASYLVSYEVLWSHVYLMEPARTSITEAKAVAVTTPHDLKKDEDVEKIFYSGMKNEDCHIDYETLYRALQPERIYCKEYYDPSKPGKPVYFMVIYSKGGKAFHSPEICYTAQGWKVSEVSSEEVNALREGMNMTFYVTKMVLTRGGAKKLTLYWYLYSSASKTFASGAYFFRLEKDVSGSEEEALGELKLIASQSMLEVFRPTDRKLVFDSLKEMVGESAALATVAGVFALCLLLIWKPGIVPLNALLGRRES